MKAAAAIARVTMAQGRLRIRMVMTGLLFDACAPPRSFLGERPAEAGRLRDRATGAPPAAQLPPTPSFCDARSIQLSSCWLGNFGAACTWAANVTAAEPSNSVA